MNFINDKWMRSCRKHNLNNYDMKLFTQVLTFTTAPVQVVAADTQPVPCNVSLDHVSHIYVEALTGNSHVSFVGVKTVSTSDGTGVISAIGIPDTTSTGARVPFWEAKSTVSNRLDLTQLYFQGTGGEGVKVTFIVED